jgi:hypothetical protein
MVGGCPVKPPILGRVARLPFRLLALLAALAATLGAAGCGGGDADGARSPSQDRGRPGAPVLGRRAGEAGTTLGFPAFATKNTTRVGGADPVADAAGVALAVYPARSRDTRPDVVVLVDRRDWRGVVAAAQLASDPLNAPVLLSDGDAVPPATAAALRTLAPLGARGLGGVQVVRVGGAPAPAGLRSVQARGADPAALARAIDGLQARAAGRRSRAVVVAPADAPAYALPAAGWAARGGDPVLWVRRDVVPAATRAALRARGRRTRIYVLGPASVISAGVLRELDRLGSAQRVAGDDPVRNAIAFARYRDGAFGWNVVDPGHGLVIANAERPADAAGAALLASTGTYGPLLLVEQAAVLPPALQGYLLDIQPGYEKDPVRGVYNHAWLLGDESAISLDVQSRIDSLLEIQPVDAESP